MAQKFIKIYDSSPATRSALIKLTDHWYEAQNRWDCCSSGIFNDVIAASRDDDDSDGIFEWRILKDGTYKLCAYFLMDTLPCLDKKAAPGTPFVVDVHPVFRVFYLEGFDSASLRSMPSTGTGEIVEKMGVYLSDGPITWSLMS